MLFMVLCVSVCYCLRWRNLFCSSCPLRHCGFATANLIHFFVTRRKKGFASSANRVFGGFWGEILYFGVKFPAKTSGWGEFWVVF